LHGPPAALGIECVADDTSAVVHLGFGLETRDNDSYTPLQLCGSRRRRRGRSCRTSTRRLQAAANSLKISGVGCSAVGRCSCLQHIVFGYDAEVCEADGHEAGVAVCANSAAATALTARALHSASEAIELGFDLESFNAHARAMFDSFRQSRGEGRGG
jgi:hypothetical protein